MAHPKEALSGAEPSVVKTALPVTNVSMSLVVLKILSPKSRGFSHGERSRSLDLQVLVGCCVGERNWREKGPSIAPACVCWMKADWNCCGWQLLCVGMDSLKTVTREFL